MSTETKPRIARLDATGRPLVSCTDELVMALAAGFEPGKIAFADNTADAVAREREAGEQRLASARDAWETERAKLVDQALQVQMPEQTDAIRSAERTRILGIQSIVRRGFEAIAQASIENGDAVDAFAMKMLLEERDRGITLDAISADAPPPAPHMAPPAPENDGKPNPATLWDRAFAKIDAKQRN